MSGAGEAGAEAARRRAGRARAILCVLASAAAFAVAAAAVKAVGTGLPLAEVVFFRNLLSLPALLLFAHLTVAGGLRAALRTRRPVGHLQRLAAGLVGMFGAFHGYAHLPLATVTALNFTMPLFLVLLSAGLLGERPGPWRWGAVLGGFLGVLLMVRPLGEAAPEGSAVAAVLAGALGWALAMISIRRMGEAGEAGVTIVLWFALGASVVTGLMSLPVWVWPSASQWGWLTLVGLVSVAAQLLMTAAYRAEDTTLVAPFEYSGILWTAALGLLVWGERPDGWDALGILVLVGAGLMVWWREVRNGR